MISSRVNGSKWQVLDGVWVLMGCPGGYSLTDAQQCQLCPAMFYCTGDRLPSTPCSSGQFALPGASSQSECFSSVFVIVEINVPIKRPDFLFSSDRTSQQFQNSLAHATNRSASFVTLDIIQAGDDPRTTTVTSRVAFVNAKLAAAVVGRLDPSTLNAAFAAQGLGAPTLQSIKITACVSGYELSPAQTCSPCPSNFFCQGGTLGRQPCPSGTFSIPGANSTELCIPAVIMVSVTLPTWENNFTTETRARFQKALALTAGVSEERVAVVSALSQARRAGDGRMLVESEIAAGSLASAEYISGRLDAASLNTNLMLYNLSRSTSMSVKLLAVSSQAPGRLGTDLIFGLVGGGIAVALALTCAGYFFSTYFKQHRIQRAFRAAVKHAHKMRDASIDHLPPDDKQGIKTGSLSLRRLYTAKSVLGSGSCSCVVRAVKKKDSEQVVAIKIIVPEKGSLTDAEKQRLRSEREVLQLVTTRKCRYTVHAEDIEGQWSAPPQRTDVGWFLMECLEGETLKLLIAAAAGNQRGGEQSGPVLSEVAGTGFDGSVCIAAARDVLAALKVLHSEGWVHCDVNPANIMIIRCPGMDTVQFKLIDFSSALRAPETSGDACAATGAPAYLPPEMLTRPCRVTAAVDIWSIAVTMFELLTTRLPFHADKDSHEAWASAITGRMEDSAPDVCGCLPEPQRQSIDSNLAKVISKALEKHGLKR
jgi:hypothetical protein